MDADESVNLSLDEATGRAVWWKRASPWWLLAAMPLTSIATSATLAPRVEVYTILACAVHKPDILGQNFPEIAPGRRIDFRDFHARTHKLHPLLDYRSLSEADSPNQNLCATDPVVQAATAKLIAVISACAGVLSLLTTGWWSSYSDRHGRGRVIGITMLGLLLSDINFILVANFPTLFPGNYWFLVIGPIIEGCLGGFTTAVAASHTYLSDTTDEQNRSQIFSLNLGLLFTGLAIGPTLGSLLIRSTGQTLSIFYATTIFHFMYTFVVFLVLPESTTKEWMGRARSKYDAELLNSSVEGERDSLAALFRRIKRFSAFLGPLSIFVPSQQNIDGNVSNDRRRDWNLTLLAVAYGCMLSIMGSYQYKFQYAAFQFSWTSEKIGYWLGLMGTSRAIFMVAVLPVAIKHLKPKPFVVRLPLEASVMERTPLLHSSGNEPGPSSMPGSPLQTITKVIHSPSFDLGLAKWSLLADSITFFFLAIAQNSWQFTVFGALGSLGMGFNPAMQSVTLALYARRGGTESGRLFGALSVIQALCSQIFGPALYGFVYARTVAIFPRAIFFLTVVTIVMSFVLLLLVRLPSDVEKNVANLGSSSIGDAEGFLQTEPLVGNT